MTVAEDRLAVLHQRSNGVGSVADVLLEHDREERDRLGHIQPNPARQTLLGQQANLE